MIYCVRVIEGRGQEVLRYEGGLGAGKQQSRRMVKITYLYIGYRILFFHFDLCVWYVVCCFVWAVKGWLFMCAE